MNSCRICGMDGQSHQATVECITALWRLNSRLHDLLPRGEEVMRVSIARNVMARIWIDGQIEPSSITRLITFLEFMREAYGGEEAKIATAAPEHPQLEM